MKILKENKYIIYDGDLKKDFKYYLFFFYIFFWEIVFKLYFLKRRKFASKKYKLCAVSCFKNEAPFLREWIEYNLLVGFDHLYLYNNNSTDNYEEVLAPYIAEGVVTLNDFPDIPCQPGIYEHWYKTYRDESDWATFLDCDEFFCPLQHTNLKEWLDEHGKYPILHVYWKMFGTSGKFEHDYNKLVTEQYVNSWPKPQACGKLIFNTNYDITQFGRGSMHFIAVKCGIMKVYPINEYGHFIFRNINRTSNKKPDIQLNHYWSKAFNCYEAKHKKGSGAYAKSWKTFDKFLWHENHNSSSDYSIYRFMIQLKLRMANRKPGE